VSYEGEAHLPNKIYGLSDDYPLFDAPGGLGYILDARQKDGQVFDLYSPYDIRYLAVLPNLSATLIIERSKPDDELLFTNITAGLVLSGVRKAGRRYLTTDWRLDDIQTGDTLHLNPNTRKNTPPMKPVVRSSWFT
jgi:hypothetical protein